MEKRKPVCAYFSASVEKQIGIFENGESCLT